MEVIESFSRGVGVIVTVGQMSRYDLNAALLRLLYVRIEICLPILRVEDILVRIGIVVVYNAGKADVNSILTKPFQLFYLSDICICGK